MKKLLAVVLVAVLSGCAVYPAGYYYPAPVYYQPYYQPYYYYYR